MKRLLWQQLILVVGFSKEKQDTIQKETKVLLITHQRY